MITSTLPAISPTAALVATSAVPLARVDAIAMITRSLLRTATNRSFQGNSSYASWDLCFGFILVVENGLGKNLYYCFSTEIK